MRYLPHEERRKIIAVGTTSYAVILPKSWCRFYGLTSKDKVLVISDGNVQISPQVKLATARAGEKASEKESVRNE